MGWEIRDFDPLQIDLLHRAFVLAFSDYKVPFAPTREQFKTRIFQKLKVKASMSATAWSNDVVIGFVLHTSGEYQGLRTAYNGGTGVVPIHRQKGIALKLYERVIQKFKCEREVNRIILEVVDNNYPAIRLYELLGFQFKRVLKCFKLHEATIGKANDSIRIVSSGSYKSTYDKNLSFEPSFMDSNNQVIGNIENEQIIEAWMEDRMVGHAIFQPDLGRISQLAVHPENRNRGIGRDLVSRMMATSQMKHLTILNIPENELDTIDALEAMGFRNEINQFELELII